LMMALQKPPSCDRLSGDAGCFAAGEEPAGGGGGERCPDSDHSEMDDGDRV
jgi:hypothetical protein